MSRFVSFILCLWPGLARLWLQGSSSALTEALIFAAFLNGALVVTFIWPQLAGSELPPWFIPAAAWLSVLCLWGSGIYQARLMFLSWATPPLDKQSEQRFRKAQAEYLRGNWVAAERMLLELLTQRPADVEGKLLLASVLRRAKRTVDARQTLTELTQLPAAGYWQREIAEEVRLLGLMEEEAHNTPETAESTAEIVETAIPPKTSSPEKKTVPIATPAPASPPQPSPAIPLRIAPHTQTNIPLPSQFKTNQPQQIAENEEDELDVIALDRVERERQRRAA